MAGITKVVPMTVTFPVVDADTVNVRKIEAYFDLYF